MSISSDLRLVIRQRAEFMCEYCGVTEIDSGGELTVDHYQPPRRGGSFDHPDNLLYCCQRCNQFKSDYWPITSRDTPLWNPRSESPEKHMVHLAEGTLYPLTPIGDFTIRRLRLNRAPLVANRLRRYRAIEGTRLLEELRQMLALQEQLQQQHAILLNEQRELLEQERELLTLLLRFMK
jgi:hypothetical protein